jgi:hypothetical protein
MTMAKGMLGWSKSASLWVGWLAGGDVGVGGSAVLPLMKRREGRGPRTVEVIWVTMGSEKCQKVKIELREWTMEEDVARDDAVCEMIIM